MIGGAISNVPHRRSEGAVEVGAVESTGGHLGEDGGQVEGGGGGAGVSVQQFEEQLLLLLLQPLCLRGLPLQRLLQAVLVFRQLPAQRIK